MISIRRATLEDIPVLVDHREAMFREMDTNGDYAAMRTAFAAWAADLMPSATYLAWLICEGDAVIGGGSMVLRHKAPTPGNTQTRSAYVYNVYVDPAHRRQGLARRLMETMHTWCRESEIMHVALHASDAARPLYQSMGYEVTDEMRILLR